MTRTRSLGVELQGSPAGGPANFAELFAMLCVERGASRVEHMLLCGGLVNAMPQHWSNEPQLHAPLCLTVATDGEFICAPLSRSQHKP
jgi:hypothetical protein